MYGYCCPSWDRCCVRLCDRLRALPPAALSDLERDILSAFDAHIGPDLAPDDYAPDLVWPWQ